MFRLTEMKEKKARVISSEQQLFEGAASEVLVNWYERNRKGRKKCINHYGNACVVCGFNFESTYGSIASGYIQVHHLISISTVKKRYLLDPVRDLRQFVRIAMLSFTGENLRYY